MPSLVRSPVVLGETFALLNRSSSDYRRTFLQLAADPQTLGFQARQGRPAVAIPSRAAYRAVFSLAFS